MIEEVLSLGVKGDDLVLSQLQKIQEQKDKFSRPAEVSIASATGNTAQSPGQTQKPAPQETKAQGIFKGILDTLKGQKETLSKGFEKSQKKEEPSKETPQPKPEDKKEDTEKKKSSDDLKEVGQAARSAVSGLATLSSGSAIRGMAQLARLIPFVGDGLAEGAVQTVNALESFRANVENASKINLNTLESKSRIGNLIQGSGGGNFTGRVDIDLNTQRALAETIGAKFGTVQKPLSDAIKEIYRDRNGRGVDITQASQLASGNFNALGTDKGFFLQKISDQLGSLPPTLRQGIQAGLLSTVKKSEQDTEDPGVRTARTAVERFDDASRRRASQIMGEDVVGSDGVRRSAADNALQIATVMNRLDGSLNQGFNGLLNGIRDLMNRVAPQDTGGGRVGRP